jgi:PAS domain S-box-containing protein
MVKSSQQSDSESKTLPRSLQDNSLIDAIFNHVPIFAGIADLEGNFIRVNQDLCDLIGYTEAELLSLKFQDLTHPDDLKRDLDQLQKLLAGEVSKFSIEKRYRHKNGNYVWTNVNVSLIIDSSGAPCYTLAIVEDISDRKHQEKALSLIVEGTAAKTGDEFFRACAYYLRQIFDTRYAFVGRLINPKQDRIRTLAFCDNQDFLPNVEYDLANTPCEKVFENTIYFCSAGVQEKFPEDQDLVKLNVQSYCGMVITAPSGKIVGHLALMDTKPLGSNKDLDLILRIFATRAGAEIERQQVESNLRQQKELLQTIIDNVPAMIDLRDPSGRLRFVNKEFERLLGWSQKDIDKTDILAHCYPDPELYQRAIANINKAARNWEDTITHTRDGRQIYVSWANMRLSDGSTVGLGQDITARKKAQTELLLGRNLLAAVYNGSTDALFLIDEQTGLTFDCNQRAVEMFEVERKSDLIGIVGNSLQKKPFSEQELAQIRHIVGTKGDWQQEIEYVTKKGKLFWGNLAVKKVSIAKQEFQLARLTDITARKQAEEARQKVEQALHKQLTKTMLLNQITDEVRSHLDSQKILETATTRIGQAFGVSRCVIYVNQSQKEPQVRVVGEYLEPGNISIMGQLMPLQDNPHAMQMMMARGKAVAIDDLFAEPLPPYLEQLYLENHSKSMLAVCTFYQGQVNGAIVLTQCDRDRHWQSVEIELLEGIAAQAGIAIAQARLLEQETKQRSELALKNAALKRAMAEARKANRAKSDFLAMMSHEIRTPMNAVIGMTELLLGTQLNRHQYDLAQNISSSGNALLAIIDDILDFSKIESGKLELEAAPFNLKQCIENSIGLFTGVAKDKQIELRHQIHAQVPDYVIGDTTRLRQVLVNLLGNGIKFTQAGQISLDVEVLPPSQPGADAGSDKSATEHLDDSTRVDNRVEGENKNSLSRVRLLFAIKDTGIGIPPERLTRLFKPFSQVDASTTRKYGGTGLGLVISKRLCKLMNGTLWVESLGNLAGNFPPNWHTPAHLSSAHGGSTFFFTINVPLLNTHMTQQLHSRTIEPTATTIANNQKLGEIVPLQILLAEDNVVNSKLAVMMLKRLGYQIDLVINGKEAIDAVQAKNYDLVFMDVQMPEIDGITATQKIRASLPQQKQPYIIAMTANAMLGDRETCLKAGMNAYLSKPIRMKELSEAIRTYAGLDHDSLEHLEHRDRGSNGTAQHSHNANNPNA